MVCSFLQTQESKKDHMTKTKRELEEEARNSVKEHHLPRLMDLVLCPPVLTGSSLLHWHRSHTMFYIPQDSLRPPDDFTAHPESPSLPEFQSYLSQDTTIPKICRINCFSLFLIPRTLYFILQKPSNRKYTLYPHSPAWHTNISLSMFFNISSWTRE